LISLGVFASSVPRADAVPYVSDAAENVAEFAEAIADGVATLIVWTKEQLTKLLVWAKDHPMDTILIVMMVPTGLELLHGGLLGGYAAIRSGTLARLGEAGKSALGNLRLAKPTPTSCPRWKFWCKAPYSREQFGAWKPSKLGKGCTIRHEVLLVSAVLIPKAGEGCVLTGGEWTDAYTGIRLPLEDATIDHIVPVKEAWRSGGRKWTKEQKEAFFNDPGNLVPASRSVNSAKGDKGPASWMPGGNADCWYASKYLATKDKWNLSVSKDERAVLDKALTGCTV
jgi:hypothetical protein